MKQDKIIDSLALVDFSVLRFPVIVVYKEPKDYPDGLVARVWDGDGNIPTNMIVLRETIREIRKDIKAAGFIARFNRQQGDDPVIEEIWI